MSRKSTSGFTLLELLVVFAIMALLIGVIPSALGKLRDSVAYRQTVQDVTALLRSARQRAVLEGLPATVVFHPVRREFGLAGGAPEKLAEGLDMQWTTAAAAATVDGGQSIVFLPEGGATGGSVSIVRRASSTGVRLRVDWLSGLVTQEAL